MPQRDRKKRKRDRHTKDSKAGRTSKSALTCKFCNLALTNVRRLAVHFQKCLHAQSSERDMVAASDASDTATEDSAMWDSGSESDNLPRGATSDVSSCCDGSTTHCDPSFLRSTPPLATRPDIHQYLEKLHPANDGVDLYHINAYREWGPKRPDASEREQARFLAVCDAGVGISDQHAQIILDYVRTREGPSLPKTVETCWKNIERAHAKMCGIMSKVVIVHVTGKCNVV